MKYCSSVILLLLLVLSAKASGPGQEVRRSYKEARQDEAYLDSLAELFGARKKVPEAYRSSFLIALSGFPELKNVPIVLEEGDLRTTMLAQPHPKTFFAPARARRFRIAMDTSAPRADGKLFRELPFDARVGVMAHELAHVLDYVKRDIGGLIKYGVRYLFRSSREKLEARTDRIAVDRGFGWQLLAFKEHLRTKAELPPSYRAYKERIYLSHVELREILREHPDYSLRAEER